MKFENKVAHEMDLTEPDDELLEWAKENINEDPEIKCQLVEELRDMIFARGECEPVRTDDAFLIRFLRARHYNVQLAYSLFLKYHAFREENIEYWKEVDLNELSKIGDANIIVAPPYCDNTGRRMILFRASNWNPNVHSLVEMFQACYALLELAVIEQRTQILGGIAIFDFKGLTLQQAMHCTPNVAKKVLQLMVNAMPMQIYAIHVLNQSYAFDVMFNVIKPFLNKMMKERLYLHGKSLNSLHKHIDPKHLPERYGGIHPDYNYKNWVTYVKKNPILISELRMLGYKEYKPEEDNELN